MDADAVEAAVEGFVGRLDFFGWNVQAVGIEVLQHIANSGFYQFGAVHRVYIHVFDVVEQGGEFFGGGFCGAGLGKCSGAGHKANGNKCGTQQGRHRWGVKNGLL